MPLTVTIPNFAWKPSSKARYTDQLEVLFPAAWLGRAFLMGEAVDHDAAGKPRYHAHLMREGAYLAGSRPVTVEEFRGGYNMPTEAEITAAPPKTLRGAYRYPVPDGWVFADENDAAVELLRSRRMLGTIGGVPFPSHEQHAADLARNGWGAP